jgi:hypothetical protein
MSVNTVIRQKPYAHVFNEIHQTTTLLDMSCQTGNFVDDDSGAFTGFQRIEKSAVLCPFDRSFGFSSDGLVRKYEIGV